MSSKGPQWMPLNVADYLKDTSHLLAHEHGAYLLLIMRYWQDGGLPADETLIRRYSLLSAEQWIESRPVLAALFDEGWKHKRIDAELQKAADLISKRSERASQQHSARRANAVHVHSTSSDTRVPPIPLPDNTAPSVPEAAGARVEFEDVWEAFPHNPSSSEAKGREAFARISAADHQAVLDAAIRYSRWFAADCEDRGRTLEAGARYVPTLAKWLDGGQWREAGSLPIKGQASGPVVPMVKLDRTKDAALWLECERLAGKKAPTSDASWSFKAELVSQARSNLTNPTHTREAVH